MRSKQVTVFEGEPLGPIDWSYDFNAHSWDGHGGVNPEFISKAVEMLREIEHGDWLATTDGGWPKVGWKRVIAVQMYDGWPHWKPVPSFCIAGTCGPEWHPFYSLAAIEKV
jgi:hypothetical protein